LEALNGGWQAQGMHKAGIRQATECPDAPCIKDATRIFLFGQIRERKNTRLCPKIKNTHIIN
jgi:hypothetical protein